MNSIKLIAPCLFGLEKVLSREIKELGYHIEKVEDGRITFLADEYGICKSNLWLRTAERVMVKLGEFEAKSFEELFQNTKKIKWSNWIPKNGNFPVFKASSIKSNLSSVPDIQSIVKKAVVESLKEEYNLEIFPETGEKYPIHVFINKNIVTLSIDTSGETLHKRGYREKSNKAPIRETLAAGLISLTPWRSNRLLVDPFCGSGTILIEAAMIALNMAPGLNREFVSEKWAKIPKKMWWDARKEAYDLMVKDTDFMLYGYDIDKDVIEIAKENAQIAGVDHCIKFIQKELKELCIENNYGFIITNPPYGERLEDKKSVEKLYRDMGKIFSKLDTWSFFVITSHPEFEALFGKSSDKKRKLYNGMLKTYFYQYFGPKPNNKESSNY
ncbi:putative N6-adenine-specific DNA methylase [Alkalithermobacter thermoalcaliphilus JW-YL-7 = DSM 7308]|uniref:N6-adenine-specific DNA methylase n=1 Tax=Alkalithermobacter thermoalcaliphilus JW-YL-7 = DSM 7308 TaxID=1121328 RepID=A0A150FQE2_CLOPD|nr:rRNA (guanine-N(2)-)-methyltransferase [[Clostridium] paradoxum JW-YL-7 = DSM 7308]SHK80247.1 putative N6-adenine-specific DNA methylase [[Clostridium] paradoxum JW-YL-7 = DSM 7308]